MDSTRAHPTFFNAFMSPKLQGKAAYSSEKELVFLQNYSDAGFHAGVFFVLGGRVPLNKLAEVLH
jgi:hypothetical protein